MVRVRVTGSIIHYIISIKVQINMGVQECAGACLCVISLLI